MDFNVTFSQSEQTLLTNFGNVQNISDGGYERGYAAGYKEGEQVATMLITNSLTEYTNEKAITIRDNAFNACTSLVLLNLPNVETLGVSCFQNCTSLVSINVPLVKTVNSKSFSLCTSIEKIVLPSLTSFISGDNFSYCYKLKYVDLGNVEKINSWAFVSCKVLETVILRRADAICELAATNAFSQSGVVNGNGYIYVPKTLVDTYKSATNWSTYANQIRAIEDYPEITGG